MVLVFQVILAILLQVIVHLFHWGWGLPLPASDEYVIQPCKGFLFSCPHDCFRVKYTILAGPNCLHGTFKYEYWERDRILFARVMRQKH